jgi:hypothetical protein
MAKRGAGATVTTGEIAQKVLSELIWEFARAILANTEKHAKVGDLLKMIEMHNKMSPEPKEQARLWKTIDEIRQEELGNPSEQEKKTGNHGSRRTKNKRKK